MNLTKKEYEYVNRIISILRKGGQVDELFLKSNEVVLKEVYHNQYDSKDKYTPPVPEEKTFSELLEFCKDVNHPWIYV